MLVPAIDVCLTAAAAEKIADVYAIRGRDAVEGGTPIVDFEKTMGDLEIARVMYYQALDLLDAIREKFAFKCEVRILARFVSVCVLEFHALLNEKRDMTHPQFMVDEVTVQYEKVINRLETEKSVSRLEEALYINCLFALGSAYVLFAERYVNHPHKSIKEKAVPYLRKGLRAQKALLQRNIDPQQKCDISVDILSIYDNIIQLKRSDLERLERRKTSREELRTVAKEHSHFILSLCEHLLTMVTDADLPLKHKNFTFEICALHNQLMDLPYVRDNVKIYACRQVLTFLKQMVPIIVESDGAGGMGRLRTLWDKVVELLTAMLKKMPQCAFAKVALGHVQRKKPTDDVETFSKLILDTIDEAIAVFPSIDIAAELEGCF
ncbi:hypothetical protein Y032_0015g2764 [Ancylostoma ceylanicum]|uniref:Uncharacterized protein n=1 Tax=Ancylostoma ceylanicum TaxID=53326 RepID=A0A016VAA3_9BILA|nr:hypothetical protein Y032_0015g2764 [Ancylostoma ceylanicum]